jgi:hypothetical protein
MHAGGRPTKRDEATVAIVKKALALGFSNKDAARAAKINPDTLQEWLLIPEFREEIESEIILRRMKRVERIENKEPGGQALAWLQERASIFDGDIRWISPDLQIRCRLFEANQKPGLVDSEEVKKALAVLGYGK